MIVTEKNVDDASRMKTPISKVRGPNLKTWISAGQRLRTIIQRLRTIRDIYAVPISNYSSNRQVPGTPIQQAGFWSRIKRFWAGVALATLAVGVLIAALILGSVIAVLLAILLIIGVAIVVVRAALLRSKQA